MALFISEGSERGFIDAMERVANRVLDYLEKRIVAKVDDLEVLETSEKEKE